MITRRNPVATRLLILTLALTGIAACAVPVHPMPLRAYVTAPARIVPGRVCLPGPPATAADLQAVLSTRGPRWAGSDGALQTLLPDGRVLWAFGDTFIGQVEPTGALGTAEVPGMVANSLQVQDGACFTPMIGGAPGSPRAVFTPPTSTTIFWPLDGYFDPVRNQVVVDSLEIRRGTFTIVAMDELYFSWPGLVPQGSARLPFPVSPTEPPYGETTLVDDGHVYLYSHLGANQYVARAPLGHAVSGPWEYWTGVDWSTTASSAGPLVFVGTPTLAPLDVVKHQDRYLGVAKIWDVASDDVSQWTSSSPTGPWTYSGRLTTTPTTGGALTYGGRMAFLPNGDPVVTYSINNWSVSALKRNVLRYGVRVVPYVDPTGSTSAAVRPPATPAPADGPIVVSGHSSVTP